eukprot:2195401-Rhodomonas_salina.5
MSGTDLGYGTRRFPVLTEGMVLRGVRRCPVLTEGIVLPGDQWTCAEGSKECNQVPRARGEGLGARG